MKLLVITFPIIILFLILSSLTLREEYFPEILLYKKLPDVKRFFSVVKFSSHWNNKDIKLANSASGVLELFLSFEKIEEAVLQADRNSPLANDLAQSTPSKEDLPIANNPVDNLNVHTPSNQIKKNQSLNKEVKSNQKTQKEDKEKKGTGKTSESDSSQKKAQSSFDKKDPELDDKTQAKDNNFKQQDKKTQLKGQNLKDNNIIGKLYPEEAEFFTSNKISFSLMIKDPFYDEGHIFVILKQELEFSDSSKGYLNFKINPGSKKVIKDSENKKSQNFLEVNHFTIKNKLNCEFEGDVSILSKIFLESGIDTKMCKNLSESISLNISSKSPNCELVFNTNFTYSKDYGKQQILFYSIFVSLLLYVALIGSVHLNNKFESDVDFCFKINLASFELYVLQNLFFMILNFIIATSLEKSLLLIFIFCLYLLKFTFFEAKIMILIWKRQLFRTNTNLTEKELQKKFCFYQLKMSLFMISYFFLMWNFFLHPFLIFLNGFLLFPQIIHNIYYPSTTKFNKEFVIFMCCGNYLVYLYLRCLPTHFIGFENFYVFPLSGFMVLNVSIISLVLQDHLGPKFFFLQFAKNSNNYLFFNDHSNYLKYEHKKIGKNSSVNNSLDSENGNFLEKDICCICFEDFDKGETFAQNTEFQIQYLQKFCKKIRNKHVMKTPCNHIFHPVCLLRWLDIRMECPCCKKILPNLE